MTHYRATCIIDKKKYKIEAEISINHHSGKMRTILDEIDEEIEIAKIQYNVMGLEHQITALEYSADGIHWSDIPMKEIENAD